MKRIFICFLALCANPGMGQHYQFSQFYAAPLYLNPAFAGANSCPRVNLNYRKQWAQVPGSFNSYQVSYDRPITEYNSGIGFSFFADQAGSGNLKTNQANFFYAYELRINKGLVARGGLSAGITRRSINYNQLRFGDQIARRDGGATLDNTSVNSRTYVDLGTGYLLYSANSWGGFSVAHLNRPEQSLNGGNSPLPMELKVHGGRRFLLGEESREASDRHSITAAANYKKQMKFNQLDAGMYYNRAYFVIGLWYRGIPLYRPTASYQNNDALIFLFGMSNEKLNIGYSFDYTLSSLHINNTKGSHEISMTYTFCHKKLKKKRYMLISCPVF